MTTSSLVVLAASLLVKTALCQESSLVCEMNGSLDLYLDWYDFNQKFHYTESGHVQFNYNITYSQRDSEANPVIILLYKQVVSVVSKPTIRLSKTLQSFCGTCTFHVFCTLEEPTIDNIFSIIYLGHLSRIPWIKCLWNSSGLVLFPYNLPPSLCLSFVLYSNEAQIDWHINVTQSACGGKWWLYWNTSSDWMRNSITVYVICHPLTNLNFYFTTENSQSPLTKLKYTTSYSVELVQSYGKHNSMQVRKEFNLH